MVIYKEGASWKRDDGTFAIPEGAILFEFNGRSMLTYFAPEPPSGGRYRVRVMCKDCGYVFSNGTEVWILNIWPSSVTQNCPKCKGNHITAVVEDPDGHVL